MKEQIAWLGKDYDGMKAEYFFDVERNKLPYRLYEKAVPLYTLKQLTPERISDIADQVYAIYGLRPPSDLKLMVMGYFARAIIKEITE